MKAVYLTSLFLSLLMLNACQQDADRSAAQDKAALANDPVLVKVNGDAITQSALDAMVLQLLGPAQSARLDDIGRKKILESLVISRLITQEANKNLSTEDKHYIDLQVERYKEELLVKQYLKNNVEPKPISQASVDTYYKENIDKFTEATVREYAVLTTDAALKPQQREKLLSLFAEAQKNTNWSALTKQWNKMGYKVVLKQGRTDEKLLQPKLNDMLKGIAVNKTSSPFLLSGKPYIARILSEKPGQRKTLKSVSQEIRKILLTEQLKQSVSTIKEGLKQTARIEYLTP